MADLVTRYKEQSDKPVYGLFIANRIDSNTAETFRSAFGSAGEDEEMRLDIIPVTLAQFKALFEALFTSKRVEVHLIRDLLDLCGNSRPTNKAPAWKREIGQIIELQIAHLSS